MRAAYVCQRCAVGLSDSFGGSDRVKSVHLQCLLQTDKPAFRLLLACWYANEHSAAVLMVAHDLTPAVLPRVSLLGRTPFLRHPPRKPLPLLLRLHFLLAHLHKHHYVVGELARVGVADCLAVLLFPIRET